ncbi:hypothetical protein [Streptomyces rhizosphaericus]|uniref:Uncharacterized protein n=2 Tax=Streptomyces rhizosphaericus TaxID=114699 RepID=A0ABN1S9Y4_9ACTN|nr:hypothetical protein [Streptomyces rhizosphaericus]
MRASRGGTIPRSRVCERLDRAEPRGGDGRCRVAQLAMSCADEVKTLGSIPGVCLESGQAAELVGEEQSVA